MQVVVGHANPDFDAYAATVAATKLFPGSVGVFLGSQNANVREFHNLHEEFLRLRRPQGPRPGDDRSASSWWTRATRPDRRARCRRDPPGRRGHGLRPPSVLGGRPRGAEDRSRLVGATTSILVHEIRDRGMTLTPLEASVMLLGIHEDTGSLTYPGLDRLRRRRGGVPHGRRRGHGGRSTSSSSRTLTAQQRLLDQLVASLEVWDVHGQQVAVGHGRGGRVRGLGERADALRRGGHGLPRRVRRRPDAGPPAGRGALPARRGGRRRGARAAGRGRSSAGGLGGAAGRERCAEALAALRDALRVGGPARR